MYKSMKSIIKTIIYNFYFSGVGRDGILFILNLIRLLDFH